MTMIGRAKRQGVNDQAKEKDSCGVGFVVNIKGKKSHKIVEQVLRTGIFTASGKPVDYSHEVEEALAPLRSATLNLLSEKWQRGTTVDVIYLSGGGAELVYEQVVEAYPQTKLVPDAQMANARGYLHYAVWREANP